MVGSAGAPPRTARYRRSQPSSAPCSTRPCRPTWRLGLNSHVIRRKAARCRPTSSAKVHRHFECGILDRSFARTRCGQCGHGFLIAYSCSGEAICPACNALRMVGGCRPFGRIGHAAPAGAPEGMCGEPTCYDTEEDGADSIIKSRGFRSENDSSPCRASRGLPPSSECALTGAPRKRPDSPGLQLPTRGA